MGKPGTSYLKEFKDKFNRFIKGEKYRQERGT